METEQKIKKGIAFAILAAALYAINAPFSKILLEFMPPTLMAGFLYVGAGIGMIFIALMRKIKKYEAKELKLTKFEINKIRITIHHCNDSFRYCCSYLFAVWSKLYNCRKCVVT